MSLAWLTGSNFEFEAGHVTAERKESPQRGPVGGKCSALKQTDLLFTVAFAKLQETPAGASIRLLLLLQCLLRDLDLESQFPCLGSPE